MTHTPVERELTVGDYVVLNTSHRAIGPCRFESVKGEHDTYVVGAGTGGEIVGFALGLVEVKFPGLSFITQIHPGYLDLV